jgi:hypothetical protein
MSVSVGGSSSMVLRSCKTASIISSGVAVGIVSFVGSHVRVLTEKITEIVTIDESSGVLLNSADGQTELINKDEVRDTLGSGCVFGG